MPPTIGVRQLKSHLSRYLKAVKAGRTVLITEHGKPVGRIVPAAQPIEVRLMSISKTGLIAWNGRKFPVISPMVRRRGKRAVADLLVENRE